MKLGVLLPTYKESAGFAFETAASAEASGLDGVFAYDHLWPMGSPQRPSLAPFPVLTAIAARCPTLTIAPLVARVGLVGTPVLVEEFETLARVAPGRVIATLGTGDRLSEDEMLAYDLGGRSSDERRALLEAAVVALKDRLPVWVGAGATATNALARRHDVALNGWGVSVEKLRVLAATGEATWAGPLGEDAAGRLDELAASGATWVVAGPPFDLDVLAKWRAAH